MVPSNKLFQVLAVHTEDTASLCTGPVACFLFFFLLFLINGLMHGFGAKAKAYGNQLLFLHWNVGNESLCTGAIQPMPLADDLHHGHIAILVTATSQNKRMHMCVQTGKLIYYL